MATINAFIYTLLFLHCRADYDYPEVNTPLGRVRGYYQKSYEGRTIAAFEGIPYAKPPMGDLRFEEPREIEAWTGVWQAINTYVCPQLDGIVGHNALDKSQEDCLYINVYTPREQPSSEDDLDVLVFIHGGAFMLFSGHEFSKPNYLLDRDFVFVTFNYRLGALGFLSTEDDVVPGNNGLKDQTLALKWVQKNIKSFGGNPNSVTIDGISAGGSSVHYHYISPLSKGLFHRGFSHSGTALAQWALQKAPLEKARQLAALVGCVSDSSTKELVQCLKQRPAKQLVEASVKFYAFGVLPLAPFGPVVEGRSKGSFVPDHPYKLLATGEINDIPWINSYTTEDGTAPGIFLLNQLDILEEQWEDVAQYVLECNYTLPKTGKSETLKKIKEFYFGKNKISVENVDNLVKLCTDRYFKLDAIRASLIQNKATKSPVYNFVYGYKGSLNLLGSLCKITTDLGVGHADDGLYLYAPLVEAKLSESDVKIKNIWLDMYTSYTKTGVPGIKGVDWQPTTSSKELTYLELISPDEINLKTDAHFAKTMEFWDSLPLLENKQIVSLKDEF